MKFVTNLWQQLLQSDLLYYYKRDKVAIVSSVVFLTLALLALLSPIIAPFDPYDLTQIDLMDSEMPPAWMPNADERFLLGTDDQGRDLCLLAVTNVVGVEEKD